MNGFPLVYSLFLFKIIPIERIISPVHGFSLFQHTETLLKVENEKKLAASLRCFKSDFKILFLVIRKVLFYTLIYLLKLYPYFTYFNIIFLILRKRYGFCCLNIVWSLLYCVCEIWICLWISPFYIKTACVSQQIVKIIEFISLWGDQTYVLDASIEYFISSL